MRILITGSRRWPNPEIVEEAIHDLRNWYPMDWDNLTIVHGDCPTGADAQAQEFADRADLTTERHPAQWDILGKKAGPVRNQEMVDLGADVVIGFLQPDSRGTTHCLKAAREAGLPTIIYNRTINKDNPQHFDLEVKTFNGAMATAAGNTIKPLEEK